MEPFHRLLFRFALCAVVLMALIYIGCELVAHWCHIRPQPDVTVILPALV